jgi:hypothetical protein
LQQNSPAVSVFDLASLPKGLQIAKNTFIEECKSETSAAVMSRARTCLAFCPEPGPNAPSKQIIELRSLMESTSALNEKLSKLLAELEPALQIDWSNIDEVDGASAKVVDSRSRLENFAELARGAAVNLLDHDLTSLDVWVRAETDEHFGQKSQSAMRLKLVGLLFGTEKIRELLSGYVSRLEENFVTSALRALMELRQLQPNLLGTAVSQAVVKMVTDNAFKPWTKHCHSACAGILGTLLCDHEAAAAADVAILESGIRIITETFQHWLKQYGQRAACLHECLWALNRICVHADRSAKWLMDCCEEIATEVLHNKFYRWYEDKPDCEEHKLLLEAGELQAWVAAQNHV